MKRNARKQLNFAISNDDAEALAHTIDDVLRMDSLDSDGGPLTSAVRVRAVALLKRILGI